MTETLSPVCTRARASFSDYLDGVVPGQSMQQIAAHLETCAACAHEFAAWRTVQDSLLALRRANVPEDLSLKLRLAISHEQARRSSSLFDTFQLRWQNTLQPALVHISAGFAMAVALLGSVAFLLGSVAVPNAVQANDEPLGALTAPHYRYSAESPRPILTPHDATIVVEATVNASGQVFDYAIVSGPEDPAVCSQVADRLLLSVFEPARVFGVAVRGRVVLTYAGVSVHG